jgi:hypothetical protein
MDDSALLMRRKPVENRARMLIRQYAVSGSSKTKTVSKARIFGRDGTPLRSSH